MVKACLDAIVAHHELVTVLVKRSRRERGWGGRRPGNFGRWIIKRWRANDNLGKMKKWEPKHQAQDFGHWLMACMWETWLLRLRGLGWSEVVGYQKTRRRIPRKHWRQLNEDSWIVDMSSVRRTFIPNFFFHQCCQHSFHNFSAMRPKSIPHHQHTNTHTHTHANRLTHAHTNTHRHTHTQTHTHTHTHTDNKHNKHTHTTNTTNTTNTRAHSKRPSS